MPVTCEHRFRIARAALASSLAVAACVLPAGCGMVHDVGFPKFRWSDPPKADRNLAARHRERFLTDGDADSLRWLLANRLESGMVLDDVNQVLGRKGEREYNDGWLKNDGGRYREGDVIYRWGPDSKGQSIYLAFREDALANFDPEEFRD